MYLGRALQKFQRPFGISKHLKHNACEYEQFNLLIFPVFNALSLACAFLNLSDLGETQTLCRPQQNGLFVFLKNLCARLMPAYGRSKHENEAGLSWMAATDLKSLRNVLLQPQSYLSSRCHVSSHWLRTLFRGCDVETKDTDYMTPFLVASRYGHLETLNWLMEYKASVTATDKDDKTCLMWAAEEDRPEAIRVRCTRY